MVLKVSNTSTRTVAGVMILTEVEDELTDDGHGLLIGFYSMEYQADVDLRP